ncbi:hypothetical protein H2200_012505 [Cladophialophora chaetospira]|uniref:Uncharacterized protein n=1 Tax=Cladophialophora chaetospira TaxID=386627 RepID=A0AA38WXZ9_9EURO|nr:hypothetical protein H2200_012505 [Cladophialophora chaetospira]
MADRSELTMDDAGETSQFAGALPPADQGKKANLVLLGCCVLQLPVWGTPSGCFPVSYGVLQENYTSSAAADLQGDLNSTGIIGTTLNGIIYLSMPLFFGLFTNRYAHLRRHATVLGMMLSVSSLLSSSWSTQVWQLILSQGVIQAFGSALIYTSSTIFLDEWFLRRKGFAYGVMLSVKSGVGASLPFLFGYLLSTTGFRTTLRIWAGVTFVAAVPAVFLLRPRIEVDREARRTRALSWQFLTHPSFYFHQVGNIIFSASYGMPQTYVPSFAAGVFHLSTSKSAFLVAALNAPSILANIWFGLLSDGKPLWRGRWSMSISTVTLVSASGSCVSSLVFWGLASPHSRAGLALLGLFSVVYGFFAGGNSSTWAGIVKELSREAESFNEPVDTALIYGLLNGGRGIGWVVGGFIGVELLKEGALDDSRWAYGTKYGCLILATGTGALFGGTSALLKVRHLA